MSKVLIVSKTRMANDNVCVGGVDFDNKRSVRLMNANGYHESQDECPYDIWDVWDCDYHSSNQRPAPHVEDVNVFNRSKQGVLKSELRSTTELAKLLKQSNIPVFSGSLMNCFDGKLKCTQHGTLFINEESVPNYSTCFWICDRIVKRSDFKGKVRYNYNDGIRNWGYNISYVGLADPTDIIPAGSLIRLSLAHWWSPSDSEDEERCYLQLSGCLCEADVCETDTTINLPEIKIRPFTIEEISSVQYADVVNSKYGKSVCFHMKGSGQCYIPLDDSSTLGVGELVNLSEAKIKVIKQTGKDDIMRVII